MNLYQMQIDNEKMAYSIAADNKMDTFEGRIKKKMEYNNKYGREAMWKMLDVVEGYIYGLLDLNNQHTRRFWWNHIKPQLEAHREERAAGVPASKTTIADPVPRIAEMVALTLASTLTKQSTETVASNLLFKKACYLLKIDYDLREDLQYHGIQFFSSVIRKIAFETSIYSLEQESAYEPYRIKLSEEWAALVEEEKDTTMVNVDSYTPMIVQPNPIKNLFSGESGYLDSVSPAMKRFARDKNGNIPAAVKHFNDETAPEYFHFLNRVQNTEYQVNRKALAIISDYYEMGFSFDKFPVSYDSEAVKIKTAKKVEEKNKARRRWAERTGEEFKPVSMAAEAKYLREITNQDVHLVDSTRMLFIQAEDFAQFEKIWFPIFLCRRGRIYTYPSGSLTYQGNKMAKALLQYANGQVLTKVGVDNMFETLGNALGMDKMNVDTKREEAFKWFAANQETFEAGDFSMFFLDSHKEKGMFDEPINALVIVLELMEFMKDPEGYECKYIAHRDARVSGPSIICTAFRDLEVMQNTSVVDWVGEDGKLGDQYTQVSDFALAEITKQAKTDKMAEELLAYKEILFTRKLFKDLTMT